MVILFMMMMDSIVDKRISSMLKNAFFLILIAAQLFVACKKDEQVIIPVTINSVTINGLPAPDTTLKISAGQHLEFKASVPDSAPPHTFIWTITPDYLEIEDPSATSITWRPTLPQDYSVKLTVQTVNSGSDTRNYNVKVLKGDFRYEVWGNSFANVEMNESINKSQKITAENGDLVYVVKQNSIPNGRTSDKIEKEERISYHFTENRLVGGTVHLERNYGNNGSQYITEYNRLKERLTEYNFIGQENVWQSSIIAQIYKAQPELLDEAFTYGYVKLQDRYESETSNIVLSMQRTGTTALILIQYTAK